MKDLKQKIQSDLVQVIKKGEEVSRSTLRLTLAAVLSKEKEKRYKIAKKEPELTEKELAERSILTNEEIIEVISSEVKKRKEAILEFEKGAREDLVKKEKAEIEVLKKYLPEQLSEEKLQKLVKETIEKAGAKEIKDMGKVMAELMPKIKGRAEGNEVSRIVREILASKPDEVNS